MSYLWLHVLFFPAWIIGAALVFFDQHLLWEKDTQAEKRRRGREERQDRSADDLGSSR